MMERNGPVHPAGRLRAGAAVLAARAAGAASRALGRGGGTALPGLIAERIAPDLLRDLAGQLPGGAVVVTGTNGKTTTSHMLAGILRAAGRPVLRNASGSNLARGVATALASRADWRGRLRLPPGTTGLFETDEAAFAQIVPAVRPRAIAVTNLFRDQLDRYGEVDTVAAIWRRALEAVRDCPALVLNADDPAVAALAGTGVFDPAPPSRPPALFFGIEDARLGHPGLEHAADAKVCPACGALLAYPVCFYGHLGQYRCERGHRRPVPAVAATVATLHGFAGTDLTLATPHGTLVLHLPIAGLYNVYNALAAAATAVALGVPGQAIIAGLEAFTAAFGRLERISVEGRTVYLILAKNPVGMNEALRTLLAGGAPRYLLLALNDLDADGRDVSWIWDADFERLAGHPLSSLVISGRRAEDLAVRLKYAGALDAAPVVIEPDLGRAFDRALAAVPAGETLYAVLTYTAMLHLRRLLAGRGYLRAYWQE
jgi:UDP-N-acetylmuramyl tripeptide synthase